MPKPSAPLYSKGRQRTFQACAGGLLIVLLFLAACTAKPFWNPADRVDRGIYPQAQWHKSEDPEKWGWSSEGLAAARRYATSIGSDAVMIVDDGVVIDAWGDLSRNYQCHSMRKSLLSSLIGIHVAEGAIDLSATLAQLGIDDSSPALSGIEKQATVGDLLRARSGVYHPALGESESMRAMRPERHSHSPGTFWYYNNWDFNALGTIFEQETGTGIFEEFNRRLAIPLQMEDFRVGHCRYIAWEDYQSAPYSRHNYYLFRMSARDLARFGLLFLRQGRWGDAQIVPSKWVQESTATHSPWGMGGGYGYMWWTGENAGMLANVTVREPGYYASGYGGHKLIVLPYRNLVVVHRVDTDAGGRRPMAHQIGRLLWLILSAAGETDIGPDPSLAAASGNKLNGQDLQRLLEGGSRWEIPNTGLFMGQERLVLTLKEDGSLVFSPSAAVDFEGRWWIAEDRFHFNILGLRSYFELVQDGARMTLFDPTGTRFGDFIPPEQ